VESRFAVVHDRREQDSAEVFFSSASTAALDLKYLCKRPNQLLNAAMYPRLASTTAALCPSTRWHGTSALNNNHPRPHSHHGIVSSSGDTASRSHSVTSNTTSMSSIRQPESGEQLQGWKEQQQNKQRQQL